MGVLTGRSAIESEEDEQRHRRVNGLESPHDSLQLIVWSVTLLISLLSIIGSYFLLSTGACILFNVVFNALLLYHLIVHFRVISIDPILDEAKQQPDPLRDKLCRECEKRAEGWDHHCFFLNTCIGKKNYWYFVQTVFSGFFVALFNTVAQVGFLIRYLIYSGRTGVELFPTRLLAVISLAAALSIAVVFHSGHLYYLHAWVLYPLGGLTAPEFFKPAAFPKSSSLAGTNIQSSKPSFENDGTRKFGRWHALRELVSKTVSTDTDPQIMEEYMDRVLERRRQTLRGRSGNSKSRRSRSRSRSRTRLMSAQNVQFKSHTLRS
jgi:hypothetical protein